MRRFIILGLLCAWPLAVLGAGLRFDAPTFESPRYAIRLTLEVKAQPLTVKEVRLNGVAFEPALVFRAGKLLDRSKPLAPGAYDVVLDRAWASKKAYTVTLVHYGVNPASPKTTDYSGVSPETGGVPEKGTEGFYRVYRVEEEAGLERQNEICTLTLTALKTEASEPQFRLFDRAEEIPYQVLDRREFVVPPGSAASNPQTVTYKLAFPLSAAPGQKKILVVLQGQAGKTAEPGLALSGENFGKTLKSRRLSVQFHPQSGQILTLEYLKEKVKLWNKAGVIHWNPDVFIPGIAWDHSFDWNPPESFEEKTGGIVYINARQGPLPHIKDVRLEVRYTVEADSPYFFVETCLSVEKDMGVIAVRNDEMVLYKELFDTLMYRDKDGQIVTMPLKEKPEAPFGLAHTTASDIPWVGLLSMKEGYGFFGLRLEAAGFNMNASGDFAHKAGTYFYAPSDGDYVYWVRPYIYTWGDYTTNNLLTFVPKGSRFYEKNAYILLRLNGQTPRDLDNLQRRLKNPLRVF